MTLPFMSTLLLLAEAEVGKRAPDFTAEDNTGEPTAWIDGSSGSPGKASGDGFPNPSTPRLTPCRDSITTAPD
jgi:hypothetical protein